MFPIASMYVGGRSFGEFEVATSYDGRGALAVLIVVDITDTWLGWWLFSVDSISIEVFLKNVWLSWQFLKPGMAGVFFLFPLMIKFLSKMKNIVTINPEMR